MEFVACGPEDGEALTAYLARSPAGDVLQTPAWGQLKARTGWVARHYGVQDGTGLRGVISVLKRPLPALPGAWMGYAPRGPVVDGPDVLDVLVRGLKAAAAGEGLVFLKVDPAVPDPAPDFSAALRRAGFRPLARGPNFEGVQPRYVMRLPLDRPPDAILSGFSAKTRYNVRLAGRRGVIVRADTTPADLPVFYRLLQETAARDRFLIRSSQYYRDLWECLVNRGLARLFMAEYRGEALAGAILFHLGTTAWYVYGASANRSREVMPNHALQWAMIRWAMDRGITVYDFRGVSGDLDPANPLYGLYRFKKGFGADLVEYIGEYDLPFRPLLHRACNLLEPFYRRLRSRPGARGAEPD
ncbi:MAG: peptidoglycan bridge formation glycyltransferase FemA/FemB family protein [bacterium]|nr:peptidoglycan bridge formation glycyltransferase FemA/FemB family protein [bacterium]